LLRGCYTVDLDLGAGRRTNQVATWDWKPETYQCILHHMRTTLRAFRLFRAKDHYERTIDLVDSRSFNIRDVDVLVTIGSTPMRLIDAHASSLATPRAVEGNVGLHASETAPDDWIQPAELYTCIDVSCHIDLSPDPDLAECDYHWYVKREAIEKGDEFRRASRSVRDAITAVLLGELGAEILNSVLYDSGTFAEAQGKPVQPLPEERAGSMRGYMRRKSGDLPVGRLATVPDEHFDGMSQVEAIGRWMTLATLENDAFKRFMWAFAGLEVIATKTLSLLRPRLSGRLSFSSPGGSQVIHGDAVRELLWPTTFRDEADPDRDPERNLIFRFSAFALTCSIATANEDVRQFKELQRFRNRIHGQPLDEDEAMRLSEEAVRLLIRYAPLAVNLLVRG
jgi:hypothetical protein